MKILITAGPTREKIDPVRYISNNSSGKMGYAIAQAACESGHEVTLISGPVSITPPPGVKVIKVVSAADMANAVHSNTFDADVIIMAAAVADYRPARPLDSKMKKLPGNLFLELERTEDILGTVGNNKKSGQLLVGFAAETDDLEKNALGKLERKNLDWIAANLVADGFGTDTNRITLYNRNGEKISLPVGSKLAVAHDMLKVILRNE
ncbi:MAG: bifunctional phosphopantothenoylcysteine decarboxylase/phosphopantothenate--cysteine ligase CoaBC [Lentisphaerae bacterium]|nr:bifunctional phosphopantothenoylcysteine decarboxylase/phosphopantothenate--cysteine ligase CoaBC [Lentisphaerota bacterium]